MVDLTSNQVLDLCVMLHTTLCRWEKTWVTMITNKQESVMHMEKHLLHASKL